ncbi:MAG: hypothetical protein ACUZ8E_12055, partial [Candidatus Anammoxibacter sp.]
LVEHISFGYLYYGENLQEKNADGKPSLFRKMLYEAKSLNKQNRWSEVAGFFWSVSGRKRKENETEDVLPDDAKEKIRDFWQWTYDQQEFVQDQLGDNYYDFLGELPKLTVLLDKIDEKDAERLILCAPHVDRHHNSDFFIEYLAMFKGDDSVKWIGKIFLKILENSTPTFEEEEIQLLVERIYKLAKKNSDEVLKKEANEICNTYGRRGLHFLKELFNRYNYN